MVLPAVIYSVVLQAYFSRCFSAAPTRGRSLGAFAGDGGEAGQAGVAHLAEVLARLYGADVYLDGRDGDGLEASRIATLVCVYAAGLMTMPSTLP